MQSHLEPSTSPNPIVVDKPYGATPLETIGALRHLGVLQEDEKATYAGRLDPLATGVLLILHGDMVHQKEQFLALEKCYEIELIFGIKTDTGDLLGIVECAETNSIPTTCNIDTFCNILESITEIPYPMFSSKTVNGKPLHAYARKNQMTQIPMRAMQYTCQRVEVMESRLLQDIRMQVQNACTLVHGDFRQEEIQTSWEQTVYPQKLPALRATIRATSGTYMRSIPEILNKHNILCTLTKIRRISVGPYILSSACEISHTEN